LPIPVDTSSETGPSSFTGTFASTPAESGGLPAVVAPQPNKKYESANPDTAVDRLLAKLMGAST